MHQTNRHRCIVQWDSFRLWESLYSDTVPILFDFDYWGFQLPVKPVEGVHYLGIKSFDCSGLVDVISKLDDAGRERIAQAGREFVLTNYGPRALAQRRSGAPPRGRRPRLHRAFHAHLPVGT